METQRQTLGDVMTLEPIVLDATATVADAARAMRARDVGDVLVRSDGRLCGIVTDRDLVVRGLAHDPQQAASRPLGEICSRELTWLPPGAGIDEAIQLMGQKAIRRIPVVENHRPVGIVSIGDLAQARDRESALGRISAAAPQR
jgi:CBS domain-containing protein